MFVVGDMNPYQAEAKSAEFFSCGFLQHTSIFVAESLVDEVKIWLNSEAQLSDTNSPAQLILHYLTGISPG